MSQIDPFSGAMPVTGQRFVSERIRKSQAMARNTSGADADEHQVESPDAVQAIHDEQSQHPQREKEQHPKKDGKDESSGPAGGASRLDVTA